MFQPCTVCTHGSCPAINAALRAGQGLRPVARRYGVSRSALSRHRAKHLAPAPVSAPIPLSPSGLSLYLSHQPRALS
jgi:hypothetical protein